RSRVKYVRLVRRKLNGVPRYYAQLVCEGVPYRKPANCVGDGVIGCDPGPRVFTFTGAGWAVRVDLTNKADQRAIRQLQRAVDRRRRANNPANYLPDGRIKPGRHAWKISARQKRAERQRAEIQRKAAATRTTRHGRLVNKLLRRGNVIQVERNSYKSFQRNFGRSVGHAAPGGFVRLLERKAASAGAQVHRLPTTLRLSQVCHGCGEINKKVLSLRVHQCACGVGPVQRDIYSAFLAQCATAIEGLDGPEWHLDAARAAIVWAGMELCLSAASGLLAVEEFTASQPANVSSPGEARLLAQASGIERVADAGAPPGREAPDAVRQRKRDGEPGKAQRPVPGTPRA
ncbi:MAG TPA: transposase, partial [Chloroflexia bacterium]|nr:transposase [Chloroflexia bacterium]